MTVSYPLDLPSSPGFSEATFRKMDMNASQISPFTGQQQVQDHEGQWWEAELTLPPMNPREARDWVGFLSSLNGILGTFYLGDPYGREPIGTASGTPVVDSGTTDSTGTELDTRGWGPNQSELLQRGDYISVNDELKIITQTAASDSNGEATLSIEPAFRTEPSTNDPITVNEPKGVFSLSENRTEWQESGYVLEGLTLPVREVMR
jgi:hypothetical protein